MSTNTSGKTVLVTGGSGYLAGWVIVGLLQRGYRVRTTLRDLSREKQVRAALTREVDSADLLSFYAADLLSDEGWDAATAGADYVLHVASPMGQGEMKPDLVRPAREGTVRVLNAAARAGVQRVVYTSSTVAAQSATVPGELQPRSDESTWTDVQQKGLPEYPRSKTLAERAAWEFIERDRSGMTLTTVLPGMILGPVMKDHISGSLELVSRLLTGRFPAIPHIGFAITDTRELVDLHLTAMLAPEAANQRFLGVGDFLWVDEIANLLRERLGAAAEKVPVRKLPDFVVRVAGLFQYEARFMLPLLGKRREYDVAKAANILDWRPRPARDAVLTCAESILRSGLV